MGMKSLLLITVNGNHHLHIGLQEEPTSILKQTLVIDKKKKLVQQSNFWVN